MEFDFNFELHQSHLKNIDTVMNPNAADSEMYCGNAHLRWLKLSSMVSVFVVKFDVHG